MQEKDADYYATRLRYERAAAATATSEEARAAHQALADEYAGLLAANGHSGEALDGDASGNDPPEPGAA